MRKEELQDLSHNRKWAHKKLLEQDSGTYTAFLNMEAATYTDGALPKKSKELIAVGISVQMNCESCMQWHIEQAKSSGARYDEIVEAIEVGIEMGGGPATVSARFALMVMESIF